MRVAIYTGNHDSKEGGGFTFENAILGELSQTQSDHQFFLVSSGPKSDYPKISSIYVNETIFWLMNKKLYLIFTKIIKFFGFPTKQLVSALDRAMQSHEIDLIWFASPISEPTKFPYILTVWDLAHRVHPYFPEISCQFQNREQENRQMIPRASYIVIGNEAGKKDVAEFYQVPKNRIFTIALPTPPLHQIKVLKKDLDRYHLPGQYLFYPAQFWAHKNHICILLALKILRDRYKIDLTVVFTGSDKGTQQYIKNEATRLGLIHNVIFLGFVDKLTLIALYKNAFALVFPSFFGPDNLPPLEAFSLGCPIIASDVAGARQQLGEAALLFNPTSEEELAKAIKSLQSNPLLRSKLVKRGYKKATEYSPNNYIKKIVKIVDQFEPYLRTWSDSGKLKKL